MIRWLHPAVVHFSVAFLMAGSLFGLLGYLRGRQAWIRFGHRMLVLGCLFVVPTLVTGYLAANSVVVSPEAMAAIDRHEISGWGVAAMVGLALLWLGWYRGEIPTSQRVAFAMWLGWVVLAVAYAGWLGGQLVYVFQVGTGS